MTCWAFNEPEGGTCLVRCGLGDGHDGRHEGTYRIREDGVSLHRVWNEDSPQHRTREQAMQWVGQEVSA